MNFRHAGTLLLLALGLSAKAQTTDYLTEGVDNGRTGQLHGETLFTKDNVAQTHLLWKLHVDTPTREMHNLFPPLIASQVQTADGVKQIGIMAGISDDLWGIDLATGKQIWHRHYNSAYTPPPNARPAGTLCPGGQTAMPAMTKSSDGRYTVYAVGWDGRLLTIDPATGKDIEAPQKWLPPNAKPYALNIKDGVVYTSVSQGCGGVAFTFFSYDIASKKSSLFVPTGGGLWGRRGVSVSPQDVGYMGTGDGEWNPEAGHFGDGIVGLHLNGGKELRLQDYFSPPNADYMFKRDLDINVTPVAFDSKGRHLLVGTSKECRVWLLDRDELGGDDHRTTLYSTPLICNVQSNYANEGVWGAMSTWDDAQGQTWLTVPFYGPINPAFHAPIDHGTNSKTKERNKRGGLATFKVNERNGKWSLDPAWISEDMDNGETAIIANGIVFAYASGEDAMQARVDQAWNEPPPPPLPQIATSMQSAVRIQHSRRATLYAFDAATGKKLWDSGTQIAGWNHFSSISVANGRAYITTFQGDLYCFGVAK